jgi:hypothetical protein
MTYFPHFLLRNTYSWTFNVQYDEKHPDKRPMDYVMASKKICLFGVPVRISLLGQR